MPKLSPRDYEEFPSKIVEFYVVREYTEDQFSCSCHIIIKPIVLLVPQFDHRPSKFRKSTTTEILGPNRGFFGLP